MSSEKIIALYERLSREDENLGESYSIQNQKKLLEDFCREKGWTRFRHFTDDGISGTTFERPSFKEMISLVEDGEVETIVLKDMSGSRLDCMAHPNGWGTKRHTEWEFACRTRRVGR